MKKYEPKSDAQLNALFVSLYGEPTDRTFGEFERRVEAFSEAYRQAESELLPLLNASEERVRELSIQKEMENAIAISASDHAIELIKKYAILESRHEAMMAELKALRSFDATVMKTDGQSVTFNNAVVIYDGHLNLIIKKYEKV